MRAFLVLLLALVAGCAGADTARVVAMRDVKFPLRDFKLPSGLRVVVDEDHRSPLVAVVTYVGSGSTSDPPGKEGLAHYVEHLAFRARPGNRSSIVGLLERAGATRWNASTSWDATVYREVGPRESLPALLALEGARLSTPIAEIPDDVAKVELQVVQNERRERNETGFAGAVVGALDAALFPPSHPYARAPIGSDASIASLTLDDARAFARAHYRPENATIVIVGDVDLRDVGRILDASLPPDLVRGSAPPPAPRIDPVAPDPPEPPPAAGIVRVEANVATPELWIGWTLPRAVEETGVVDAIIAHSVRQATREAVRHDGDIAGVDTHLVHGSRAAALYCRVALRSAEHPEASRDHVLDQIYRSWRTQGDVRLAFALRGSFIGMLLDAQALDDRAVSRAELTHLTLDPLAYSRRLKDLAQARGDSVTAVVSRFVTRERARTVLAMAAPDSAPPPPDTSVPAPAAEGEPDATFDAHSLRARIRPVGVSAFRSTVLPNGLELVVGRHDGLPVATVGVGFRGGSGASEPFGSDKLLQLLGTKRVTGNATPATFGGHERSQYGRDQTVYVLEGAAGNVGDMMSILASWTPSRRVDSGAVAEMKRWYLPFITRAMSKPEVRADAAFEAALFGARGYGRTLDAAKLEALGDGDADAWAARTFVASNATVVIVGEIDVDKVEQSAKEMFGGWTAGTRTPPVAGAPHPPLTVQVTHRGGASQAVVRLGCRLPDDAPPATREVLGRLVRSRLWQELRGKAGSTYGAHVETRGLRGGATELEIHTALVNADLGPGVATLRRTLADLAAKGPGVEALELARWQVTAGYASAFMTTRQIVENVLAARNGDRTLQSIDGYPEAVGRVAAPEISSAARACVDSTVLSIVGDEPTIKAALAAP